MYSYSLKIWIFQSACTATFSACRKLEDSATHLIWVCRASAADIKAKVTTDFINIAQTTPHP